MLDLLTDPTCLACDAPCADSLCFDCRADLEKPIRRLVHAGTAFDGAFALGEYGGVAGRLVRGAKFGHNERAARLLADGLASALGVEQPVFDLVIAVPTTPWRWLARGFHLPDLLAQAVGRSTGRPVVRALRRRWGAAQSGRASSARLAASAGVFQSRPPVSGRVLLVDDVVTSGGTAQSAAFELLAQGASSVCLAVAASSGSLPSLHVGES